MAIPFKDAVKRLVRLVETCPELREEFDNPRYYPEIRRPDFFQPGELPGTWGKPRELAGQAFTERAEWFLRRLIGSESSPRIFLALGEDGGPLWIRWNWTPDLVYCKGDGGRETEIVPNAVIYLDEGEFKVFCGLADPERRLFLDWEAACLLAGKAPEPVWKYTIRQALPPDLPKKVELYRAGITEDLYPAELVGKLKLYAWEAVRTWARRKGVPVPEIAHFMRERTAESPQGAEPSSEFISLCLAEKCLAERFNRSPEEIAHDIAGWIWHRQLTAYTNVNELGGARRFYFPDAFICEEGEIFDYLPWLENCYFKTSDIQNFDCPAGLFNAS